MVEINDKNNSRAIYLHWLFNQIIRKLILFYKMISVNANNLKYYIFDD
jgi:hypothetical protein